jgi:23S rRNA pseudouridine2605 synthase
MEKRKPTVRQRVRVKKMSPVEIKQKGELIRLNRFIAGSGVCSRREADEIIKQGLITINGKQVTDLGIKVTTGDDVRYKNKKLAAEKKVYILLNKPKDYVTI